MNIDSIYAYQVGTSPKAKHKQRMAYNFEQESVDLCDKKDLNRGYYSGSFTGKNEAAAAPFKKLGKTFSDKIFRSNFFKSLLDTFENNSVVASTLVALIVAGVARPITNLAMADDKDREDSIYAASHAIASAIIGFVVSSIIMAPFAKAFRMIKDDPEKYLKGLHEMFGIPKIGKRQIEKSKAYKKLSKTAQFIPDALVMGVPKAMLTIALIPPILKYVFKMEKGKKHQQSQVNEQNIKTDSDNNMYVKNIIKDNKTFQSFEGGVR